MRVITLLTQKGGTGKTTLVASLGVAAKESGERVFLIDLDPQGSLTAWGERRQADAPPVDRITPDKLDVAVQGLRKARYGFVIIDTAGTDSAANSAAMRKCDLALIPARPSILDIEATRPTVTALSRLGKPFAFAINQAPPGRSARSLDASRALGLLGVLADPVVHQRADHLDALALGLGVTEHAPSSKAAAEVRALWAWISRRKF